MSGVHVVEVPSALLHNEDALAQRLTAKGIQPNDGDHMIRLQVYGFEDEPQA
jgi:hypothetical protein